MTYTPPCEMVARILLALLCTAIYSVFVSPASLFKTSPESNVARFACRSTRWKHLPSVDACNSFRNNGSFIARAASGVFPKGTCINTTNCPAFLKHGPNRRDGVSIEKPKCHAAARALSSHLGVLCSARWIDHLPGVWYLYFPSNVHETLGIQSELPPGEPLKLWIDDKGDVSCPVLNCKGSASAICEGRQPNDSVVSITLDFTTSSVSRLQFQGILAFSTDPVIVLWKGLVRLHSAIFAGGIFATEERSKANGVKIGGVGLPENVEVLDGSGRVLTSDDSGVDCNSSAEVDETENNTKCKPTTALLGPFVAQRILGEDRSVMQIQHKFLEYGPRSMYRSVGMESSGVDVVDSFFGGPHVMSVVIGGHDIECKSREGSIGNIIVKKLEGILQGQKVS